MGKHSKKKNIKIKNKRKFIIVFLQLVLIVILIYSLINIIKWYNNNKQSEKIMREISNAIIVDTNNNNNELAEDNYQINFEALKEANSNTVGFLKVNGTDIQYPVVKGADNDFYLTHSFDKSYNSAGWIFADYKNKFDGTDKNIIIYGHNRRDGSMFYTLKNILNEEWYTVQENLKVKFITENEENTYEVFSVYQIEAENYYIQTNFKSNDEYAKFIDTITKRSKKDFNVDVTTTDNILTLSTCANNNKYRVVLHAKKIK